MKIGVNSNLQLRLKIDELKKQLELETTKRKIAENKLKKYENRISRTR
jgi:hypothetical protein|tara:strand:+ start:61 stop:204 length:144 start_codon:yes stop_codon:yes gene_type:complete